MRERVVITGIGMVTPLGTGKETFSQRLFNGDCGIAPIRSFDTSRHTSKLGAEVRDFIPKDFISIKNYRRMDRISAMTVASARMALDDAGFVIDNSNKERVGMILGVSYGSTDIAAQFATILFTEGPASASPILVPNSVINAPAGHASIELGFCGFNTTVNHREASGETAIAFAASRIKAGQSELLLTGGADILSEFFFEILMRFKVVSPDNGGKEGVRPFDKDRNGPVAGEGAGVLCVESLSHAVKRGAVPYCEIAGWGMSSSPASPSDWPVDPKGPILAMERALAFANITPDEIDYVSASANGGRKLDQLEAEALSLLFSKGKNNPLIGSIKAAVGESFSSGGIRTASMALSIQNGIIPPTLGLENPINALPFVLKTQKTSEIRYGLICGFSSGGTFVSLVLKRFNG
jgi:3-oxoacyl-[acyl-carrier-protein] synthase II